MIDYKFTGGDLFILGSALAIAVGVAREWLRTPHSRPDEHHTNLVLGRDVLMARSDATGIYFYCRSEKAERAVAGSVSIHYLDGTIGRGTIVYNNTLVGELKVKIHEYTEA